MPVFSEWAFIYSLLFVGTITPINLCERDFRVNLAEKLEFARWSATVFRGFLSRHIVSRILRILLRFGNTHRSDECPYVRILVAVWSCLVYSVGI